MDRNGECMDKRVLLIGDLKSFMVTAIARGIEREDFTVERVGPSATAIARIEDPPKIWVFYLDTEITKLSETLVFCKDEIAQKELYFYMVGSPEELENTRQLIPEEFVRGRLERPLNINDLTQLLSEAVEEGKVMEAKKRILVVDDDPTMTRTIKNLLSSKYNVYMASSGMNAITFLAKNTVDLILLDYEMPVVSGAKVMEMIRSEPATAGIPVMFLTGKSDRETVLEVLALKPVKYLLKSMHPAEWIKEIDDFFAFGTGRKDVIQ